MNKNAVTGGHCPRSIDRCVLGATDFQIHVDKVYDTFRATCPQRDQRCVRHVLKGFLTRSLNILRPCYRGLGTKKRRPNDQRDTPNHG
nr:hypothetical protein [uncultured bacterium]